ncbi:MAG: hypothetical protein ACI9G9_000807 [Psychromonas sp.]|jgi:hypothetical protein
MKAILFVFSILLTTSSVYGQQDTNYVFFNEFDVSLNKTSSFSKTKGGYGFGIGAYIVPAREKRINVVFGFEYNFTQRFQTSIYGGHNYGESDVSSSFGSISIPLLVRANFGNKVLGFFQLGGFFDLGIYQKSKGVKHVNCSDSLSINCGTSQFSKIDNGFSIPGLIGGIGTRIPIKKKELILTIDYKFGPIERNARYGFYVANLRFKVGIGI